MHGTLDKYQTLLYEIALHRASDETTAAGIGLLASVTAGGTFKAVPIKAESRTILGERSIEAPKLMP